jgi:soluble lytic murein transglycosylase
MNAAALLALITAIAGGSLEDSAPADVPPEESDPGYVRVLNPAFPTPVVRVVPIDRGPKVEREDLAPYFATGKRAGAKWAFDEGRLDKALKLLEGEGDSAPVRYLRGLIYLRGSDFQKAAAELQSLADLYPPMRDRCLVQAAWAYEGMKNFDAAAKLYEKVSKGSRQYFDARLGLARARRYARDLTAAKAAIAEFLDKPPPPWGRDVGADALLSLADIYAAKRDEKAERETLLKLWSAHPMSPQAVRAAARMSDPPPASVDQKVTRAEALIDAHRNVQGIEILQPIVATLKLPEPTACRAHFALGKGQRKQRAHAKSAELLGAVVKKCTDPELRARALFILGFSRTIVDSQNAAATFELLARDYPGHPYADDSLFSAAEVRFKEGDQDKGMRLLAEIVERYPNGDFVAEALFKRFWILRRANDLHGAAAALDLILARFANSEDSFEIERASYWRARLLASQEDLEGALALYEKTAKEHPTTYYGLSSRERLAESDPARAAALLEAPMGAQASDPFPLFAGPVARDPNFATAVELLRLGFGDLVPSEILAIDRTAVTVDSLRLMVQVLSLAGKEREAHGLARIWLRKDLGRPINAETKALFVIAYPNAFRAEVEKASELADKLDPNLLQALMREESALDPKVRSWAGALGLTQLMPATAAEVAQKLKLKKPSIEELLEPELNLRIGGRYLADLLKRAKGVKHYAIAGYNAGEGAVKRWRALKPENEIDEWVEDIPLSETRGYVKRVLRSYNTYQLLYPVTVAGTPAAAARR